MHRSRRSSTSEDSSPPSNPRRCRRSRSRSQSSARSSRSFVDLNCSQESTQFPEETPPSAFSSPAPDYGATDLRMRDPQFRRQTMGGAAPPAASNKSPSKGATGGKLTPVDLFVTGRMTSSKSSSSKSSKICPYCTDSPGENLRRHAYGSMSPGIWTPHGYAGHAYNPSSNPLCLRLTGSNVPREASSGMQPPGPPDHHLLSQLPRSCLFPPWKI